MTHEEKIEEEKTILMLLSARYERFSVSRMRDLLCNNAPQIKPHFFLRFNFDKFVKNRLKRDFPLGFSIKQTFRRFSSIFKNWTSNKAWFLQSVYQHALVLQSNVTLDALYSYNLFE